jgi:signal transduction histidine kinase/ActR/RegA family two-component response regulator
LAPKGRDAEVISDVLARGGLVSEALPNLGALVARVGHGAAAAIIAVEALAGEEIVPLASWLASQEPWSDFPIVALLPRRLGKGDAAVRDILSALGNVVILERPLSIDTLASAAASALRARRRQYAAREAFSEKLAASEALASLNQTLEAKVSERTGALAQANDLITAQGMERERANQTLAHYQKMEALGRLTGGMAHDFNNVLSVIQSNVELIALLSSEERIRERAGAAKSAVERGAKLTGQLLSFARNQSLDLRPLSVALLFEAVAGLARPLLGPSIELSTSIEAGAERALSDASQLEMAMLNLAINARDALDGSGKISFRASRGQPPEHLLPDGDYVLIEVCDTGPGMSEDVAARVFEPFFTTKPVGKGTGLGLSQVYVMAQRSGGAAFVLGGEGTGATIGMWLPFTAAEPAADAVRTGDGKFLAGMKVLVVEDDDLVRAGMVDALAEFGCEVAQASSGAEGLFALASARPDLLLTDYMMPNMNGAQLAAQARALYPGLPVLVATGYADMAAIEAAGGGTPVLRKPFKLADLEQAVARAVGEPARSLNGLKTSPTG